MGIDFYNGLISKCLPLGCTGNTLCSMMSYLDCLRSILFYTQCLYVYIYIHFDCEFCFWKATFLHPHVNMQIKKDKSSLRPPHLTAGVKFACCTSSVYFKVYSTTLLQTLRVTVFYCIITTFIFWFHPAAVITPANTFALYTQGPGFEP